MPYSQRSLAQLRTKLLPDGHLDDVPFEDKLASHGLAFDVGTCPPGVIGNIVWLLLAGWWLALGHLVTAVLLAVTIVGIPFAWAHLKLAGLALWPIGKAIVPVQNAPLR